MNSVRLFSIIAFIFTVLLISCTDRQGNGPFEHPFKNPPSFTNHKRCDNCGMDRNRFARTRYVFDSGKGRFYTCSIACLVILSEKMHLTPKNVRVAEYINPSNMIDALKAVYVIGSKARGTMTRTSKIAFSSKKQAERFVSKYGGRIATFAEALQETRQEILKEIQR